MKPHRRRVWISGLLSGIPGMALGFLLGCHLFAASFTPAGKIPPEAEANFRIMAEAWNTIQRVYVERTSLKPQRLMYGAVSGMVGSLGDTGHSRFLTPEMVAQERNFTKGELEGIGTEVQMKDRQLVIVAPIDGSPAQRAGLQPGDIVLRVDGQEITGLPVDQAVALILGPPGTKVTLMILSPKTQNTREVTLTRAKIILRNVVWRQLPETRLAHLRISTFSENVTRELRKALEQIHQEKMNGIILDLRNNPGGLFTESIRTASQFVGEGNVVLEKDSQGAITPIAAKPGGLALTIPLVCLINNGTGSASEIVAGALKDAHRAQLVGEKSFGTGTVLERFFLSDGSALLLATKEWLTPAGQVIWHKGISPDIAVALPPNTSPLFPDTERGLTAEKLRASGDAPLLRAIEVLRNS